MIRLLLTREEGETLQKEEVTAAGDSNSRKRKRRGTESSKDVDDEMPGRPGNRGLALPEQL